MSANPRKFILPDLFAVCPFKSSFNPHHAAVSPEASAWIGAYSTRLGQSNWSQAESSGLFVANACPDNDYEQFRTSCNAFDIIFILDMISEENTSDDFKRMAFSFYNAVHDAEWDDGSQLARMGKEYVAPQLVLKTTVTEGYF